MGLIDTKDERRKHRRYAKNITVQVNNRIHSVADKLAEENQGGDSQHAVGKNISMGGLCLVSPFPYEINTVLGLIIRISDLDDAKRRMPMYLAVSSIPIAAEGQVVRCIPDPGGSGYEIGIMFVDIYEDDHRILMKHLGE